MSRYQIKEYDVPEGITEEEAKEIVEILKNTFNTISQAFMNLFDSLRETFNEISETLSEVEENDTK